MEKLTIGDIVELEEYPVADGYNPYVVRGFRPSIGGVLLEELGYTVETTGEGVKQRHPLRNVRQYPVTCPNCGAGITA